MNSPNKHLREHSKKQLSEKMRLQNTLNQVKNQSDYEMTVKVGETNDICRKLKNGMHYVLDTKGGQLQIIEMGKNGESVIKPKHFERKYENYKRAALDRQGEQEEEEGIEEDLKRVLVEVMCLSSEMRRQIKVLGQKGISTA